MPSQTKIVAGTVVNDASSGTVAWVNVNNAKTSDDSFSTATLSNQSSQWIMGTNFGFTIPAGAKIDNFVAEAEMKTASGSYVGNVFFTMVKGDVNQQDNDTGDSTTLDTTERFIVLTDPTAFHLQGYTIDDVNASGFGMGVRFSNVVTDTISVDSFKITITYNELRAFIGNTV